jgi:F0F1-type ATP synthase assembly protein I
MSRSGSNPLSGREPGSFAEQGVHWASQVISIGLVFALPPFAGYGLDRLWGTGALLTIVGGFFGFAAGMYYILLIAREGTKLPRPAATQETTSPKPAPDGDEFNEIGTG